MPAGAGCGARDGVGGQIWARVKWAEGGRSDCGGEGCNELAAMWDCTNTAWFFRCCEASILTAAETKEREQRKEVEEKGVVTQTRCGGGHISLRSHPTLNLPVLFNSHSLSPLFIFCLLLASQEILWI